METNTTPLGEQLFREPLFKLRALRKLNRKIKPQPSDIKSVYVTAWLDRYLQSVIEMLANFGRKDDDK